MRVSKLFIRFMLFSRFMINSCQFRIFTTTKIALWQLGYDMMYIFQEKNIQKTNKKHLKWHGLVLKFVQCVQQKKEFPIHNCWPFWKFDASRTELKQPDWICSTNVFPEQGACHLFQGEVPPVDRPGGKKIFDLSWNDFWSQLKRFLISLEKIFDLSWKRFLISVENIFCLSWNYFWSQLNSNQTKPGAGWTPLALQLIPESKLRM